ncbi:MAG TPA: type II secretion system F family protein [Acidimicrobiales bacterium]
MIATGAVVALVAAGWAAAVLGLAWPRRPAPGRVRALVPAASSARRSARPARPGPLERLGATILRRAGRPSSPAAARRVGTAAAFSLALLPVMPAAAVPAAAVVWALPGVRARRAERRRLAAIEGDLPDVVDLLVLAVGSGLTVHLAVSRVAARASGPLSEELSRIVDEVSLGRRLSDALDDLPARAGEATRPLVGALVASERYGAPLVAGLERLSDEVRRDRRRRAEEAARKVPVKLLFPLVACTLPAFGLLTVAPLVASAVRSLRL